MPVDIIRNTNRFAELCEGWSSLPFIAIDTEFVRTNTFYPKIGLLQIADHSKCYLVDPLSIQDWSCFTDLLANPGCTFVIHSSGEDLNLLNTTLGQIPLRIFDTQIAAAFLGLGYSVSYQALVAKLLSIDLPKDETRSDWLNRPLSQTQLLYAANDVCYLLKIQKILYQQLITGNKLNWLESECAFLLDSSKEAENITNWYSAYADVSNAWKLNKQGLQYLQALSYWREDTARKRDKPRYWIAKDVDLFNIADQMTGDSECTLNKVNCLELSDERLLGKYADQIYKVLKYPNQAFDEVDTKMLNRPLDAAMRVKLKACQQVVKRQSEELNMAPELLARKKILHEQLWAYKNTGGIVWAGELSAWRREVLESEFVRIYSEL